MSDARATTRHTLAVVPALLASLLLTACGGGDEEVAAPQGDGDPGPGGSAETRVVSTEQGDVEIPADPQKVVVLNPALTGYLYALETPVHAAVPLNTDVQEFPASYADEAAEDGTEFVPWSNDGFDLEFLQLAEPDLIIAGGNGFPGMQAIEVYEDLSGIAPTVIAPREARSWQEELDFLADDVLDKPDAATELVEGYEARVAEVADAIETPQTPVGYLLLLADERRWTLPEDSQLPTLLADVGMDPYPVMAEHDKVIRFGSGDTAEVPSELASEVFVAPTLFVTGFQVDNVDLEALGQDPILGGLPAFESGAVHELPEWSHRPDYYGALLLLDQIEQEFS